MANSQKLQIVIDAAGQLAGAGFAPETAPSAKGGAAPISAGVQAGPGQSVHTVVLSEDLSALDGAGLLALLGKQEAVQAILRDTPTAGHAQTALFGAEPAAAGQPSAGHAAESMLQSSVGAVTAGRGA